MTIFVNSFQFVVGRGPSQISNIPEETILGYTCIVLMHELAHMLIRQIQVSDHTATPFFTENQDKKEAYEELEEAFWESIFGLDMPIRHILQADYGELLSSLLEL